MHLELSGALGHGVQLSDRLPGAYQGPVLKGSEVLTTEAGGLGRIVQQELRQPGYSIRLHVFNFLRPFRIKAQQPAARLVSVLALKNNLEYQINGLGKLRLKQGQFSLLHGPATAITAKFRNQKTHECMVVSWTDEWLSPLAAQFPVLQSLFDPITKDHPLLLPPRSAGTYALDTVQDMLHTPLEEGPSRLLFENKVREYLIFLLVEAAKKDSSQVMLTARERELLQIAGEQVQQTFDRKFHLRDLSRQTGINATKFKEGFREIHGITVKQLSIAARLQEARRLLMETDLSTKQIKDMVSYAHTTTFIKAFRDYFGYTPSEARKLRDRQ